MKVRVEMFKQSGKWYTGGEVELPENIKFPWDSGIREVCEKALLASGNSDFNILVNTPNPWGFPHLFMRRED